MLRLPTKTPPEDFPWLVFFSSGIIFPYLLPYLFCETILFQKISSPAYIHRLYDSQHPLGADPLHCLVETSFQPTFRGVRSRPRRESGCRGSGARRWERRKGEESRRRKCNQNLYQVKQGKQKIAPDISFAYCRFFKIHLPFSRQWAQDCDYASESLFQKFFSEDIKYLLSMDKLWAKRKKPVPLNWQKLPEEASASEADKEKENRGIKDQQVWSIKKCAMVFEESLGKLKDRHKVIFKNKKEEKMKKSSNLDFFVSCLLF